MRSAATTCALLLTSAVVSARPGNPERYPVGAGVVGAGGAAVGAGTDVWHNPAGLGHVAAAGLSASVSAYGYTIEEAPEYGKVELAEGELTGKLRTRSIDVFPASLGYVKPLGTRWGLRHGAGISVVVPDFDQFDGKASIVATDFPFSFRVRRQFESETFWLVPGWGACAGAYCLGLALTAAARVESDITIKTLLAQTDSGDFEAVENAERYTIAGALGGMAGGQAALTDRLWLGATVRTPVDTVYTYGSSLHVVSVVSPDNNFVDRVEVNRPRIELRQPWRFALGAGYDAPDHYSIALDLRLTLPLAEYATYAGPDGEITMQPVGSEGTVTDPARAIRVARFTALGPSVNANLGGQLLVLGNIILQAGLFTDFSATRAEDVLVYGDDQLHRIGLTLGAAYRGEQSTTWVTVIYAMGRGETVGFRTAALVPARTELQSQSALVMLGSSTGAL